MDGEKAETRSRPEGEREKRKVSRTRILIEVSIISHKPVTSTNTIWPKCDVIWEWQTSPNNLE
jgi:hypothetical protein